MTRTTPKKTTKKPATKPARATAKKAAPKAAKPAPAKPAPRPLIGQRWAGVKDKVLTDYLVAAVGPGGDPLVAFFICNKAHPARFAATTIRWSLFLKVHKAQLAPLSAETVAKLSLSRAERGAALGSRA